MLLALRRGHSTTVLGRKPKVRSSDDVEDSSSRRVHRIRVTRRPVNRQCQLDVY